MKRLSLRRYKPSRKQAIAVVLALAAAALALNWIYQVIRKPAELFFPVSGALDKTPAQTWREYETIFRGLYAALQYRAGPAHIGPRLYWGRISEESGRSRVGFAVVPLLLGFRWSW